MPAGTRSPPFRARPGTVASFATFAVAFLARPVGAVLFGHYGDRLGRKRTLIYTLLLMGFATVLIGLLPSAQTIGVAAPIILVVLRLAQGFAVGGEWAGATLLAAEYAPKDKRGLYGVFPQLGPAFAFALASATFLTTSLVMGDSDTDFLAYGWRIPPQQPRRLPFIEVLRSQPREVLLSAGSLTMLFAFFYIGTAYLTSYATSPQGAGLSRPVVLGIGIGIGIGATILAGVLSDRFGRRKVIMASCGIGIEWGLALFPLLDTGTPVTGLMLSVLGTLSIVCTFALTETRGVPMAHEQAGKPPHSTETLKPTAIATMEHPTSPQPHEPRQSG